MPCPAPLWIPAFAGTTVGGVGCGGGCWSWWGEGPAAAGRAVREPPLRGLGSRGCDRGLDGVPRRAPVPSFDFPRNQQARPTSPGYCLSRNDVGWWRNAGRPRRLRAAPVPWIPVLAGTTMGVCGPVGAAGGGGPFDRLRANGIAVARVRWGVGDAMRDRGAPRRAPLDSCLRRNDARGGVREGREVGTSPRLAPALGSRESGNDDGGCGGMRWREGLVSGWGPALAGGRFSNRPYDRGGAHEGGGEAGAAGGGGPPSCALRTGFDRLRANGFGKRACGGEWGMRWGTETPRAAPLPWVPVFTGTTMGGVVVGEGWWRWGEGPALAGGRFGKRACDGVLAGLGSRWGVGVGRRYSSGFLPALEVEWGETAGRRVRARRVHGEGRWMWRSLVAQTSRYGAVGCLDTVVLWVLVCCIWTQHLVYG